MTTADIDDIISDVVLLNEGGYSNNPADAGGETNFGITVATARSQGYTGAMKDMPRAFAAAVYRKQYADAPGFSAVGDQSLPLAAILIDIGVNMGPATASVFLQRCLNALNEDRKDYADIVADGAVGPATLAALRGYLWRRGKAGETVLVGAIRGLRVARYIALCEGHAGNEVFAFGWLTRALQ